uniref:Uncharacterized protein n=1 Tax=Tanacetum cinerariifolium TaxID=118510 RepID=A0A6L2MWX2_TANCI|nr:hypothetical protein [Tanacetum cinerariifolium]
MIASSNSRISLKNMTRFSSNDMVHNHYLEEAKKRTQERSRNSKPSLMHSARSQSTANSSKPVPRRNTQTSRIWLGTKNRFVTTKTVPIAEHPRNFRNVSYVTKFLKETAGLRWVPTRRILTYSTTKVDSEPLNGSNADITNQYECEQNLDVSADISETRASRNFHLMYKVMTSDRNSSELGIHDHSNEVSSSKLVPKVVPPASKTATS